MNTASSSGSGSLPSNTIANPKGELKSITTRSVLVLDGPSVPMPPPFINPEEDERAKETLTGPELAEYTIKEKLLELANTPLNENCSAVILKKLPEKLGDPGKFLIPCGFSELKCKTLTDLDIFVPIRKFTFLADFVIVDYESNPRVPLILGRPFLRTARALIDVHREEMILHDGDKRLILNMRHDTSNYSNKPHKESINMIDIYNASHNDYLEDFYLASDSFPPGSDDTDFDPEGDLCLIEELLNNDPSSPLPLSHNPLSGSTISSSHHLLEEFAGELVILHFSPRK
ncbi:reverse transcriptase domain-containing protein [Tanacetum coccineum]